MHTILLYDIFSRKSTIKLAKHFEEAGEKSKIVLMIRKTICYDDFKNNALL
jgi:hypothetical protein